MQQEKINVRFSNVKKKITTIERMNSSFRPPNMDMGVSTPNNGSSPPRMGFVAGADGAGEMNGYVGGKPATREPLENSQSYRQQTNFASPDPALSQSAFTQSQFTQNVSAASSQSANAREEGSTQDKRMENLRKFKEGNSGNRAACGLPGRSQLQQPRNAPVGRATQQQPVQPIQQSTPVAKEAKESSSFVAYTLSDPGYMYKAFSGSTKWFRVAQLIVPEGKVPKKVSLSSMLVGGDEVEASYSLRLVDPSETPAKTLWAEYSASNIDNFQVYTIDLSGVGSTSQLLEIQAQHATGAPILVSSIIMEFSSK